jgi:hypothetical protein
MKTLRAAYFSPLIGHIALYVTEDKFTRSTPQIVTDLPTQMQGIVAGAVQWLTIQLPEGMQTISQIILTRLADVPTEYAEASDGEIDEPIAWSATFEISVTGQGEKGETSLLIYSTPGEVTNAVAALWDYLVTQI